MRKGQVIWPLLMMVTATSFAWLKNPTQYIADDSYFYLVVGRYFAASQGFTFNGIYETNGFQPLWQWLVAGFYWIVEAFLGGGILYSPRSVVPLAAVALGVGAWLHTRLAHRFGISSCLSVGVPFVYVACLGLLGSEAHLLYLAFGWSLLEVTRPQNVGGAPFEDWRMGLSLGLLCLARLDAGFLAMALLYLRYVPGRRFVAGMKSLVAWLCLLLPSLAYNFVRFGSPVPISGMMKSSFPFVAAQRSLVGGAGIALTLRGYSLLFGVLPLLWAMSLWFLGRRRTHSSASQGLILACTLGVLGQLAYVMLFTRSHTSWYWYYVTPVVVACLATALFVRAEVERAPEGSWLSEVARRLSKPRLKALTWVTLSLVIVSLPFVRSIKNNPAKHFALVQLEGRAPSTVMVSDWPGELAFKTHHRIVAADLLTANVALYRDLRESPNALVELFRICSEAGAPVDVVLHLGSAWLRSSDDQGHLIYNDPLEYPTESPFGRLDMPPPETVSESGGYPRFVFWDLAD